MPLTSTLRKCPWRPPQLHRWCAAAKEALSPPAWVTPEAAPEGVCPCLLYTSDAADDTPCVDL
eukprot:6502348-Pyramimonas_sp.AAC.1